MHPILDISAWFGGEQLADDNAITAFIKNLLLNFPFCRT